MHREAHDSPEGKILVVVIFVSFVVYAFFAPSMIEAQAKKEGALTLYTTIAEKDLPTLIKPFESKYGVKVTVWRAGTSNILQRAVQETAAKKYAVDVIHIGTNDLSTDLGHPGELAHPEVIAAIGRVAKACKANGKFTGVGGLYGGDAAKALPEVIKLGAQFITSASEWNLMMMSGIERVKSLRAFDPTMKK